MEVEVLIEGALGLKLEVFQTTTLEPGSLLEVLLTGGAGVVKLGNYIVDLFVVRFSIKFGFKFATFTNVC